MDLDLPRAFEKTCPHSPSLLQGPVLSGTVYSVNGTVTGTAVRAEVCDVPLLTQGLLDRFKVPVIPL